MFSTFAELESYILDNRDCGIVHVHLVPRDADASTPRDAADSLVASLGFRPARDHWETIGRNDAQRIISHILHQDLAYDSPMIRRETSDHIAERFAALFDEFDSHFFTNCTLGVLKPSGFSWHPITQSTMECAVVIVDDDNAGLVLVEDED